MQLKRVTETETYVRVRNDNNACSVMSCVIKAINSIHCITLQYFPVPSHNEKDRFAGAT